MSLEHWRPFFKAQAVTSAFTRKSGRYILQGHGSRDAFKHLYDVTRNTSTLRVTLAIWDEMALGIKSKNAEAPYPPTGEIYEVAYMRVLTVDSMPDGLGFSLKVFREWREASGCCFLAKCWNKQIACAAQGLGYVGHVLARTNIA